MGKIYNQDAPKKPTNLTVNSDLLAQAKTMKINISATLESALAEAVKQKKREEWLAENAVAISNYNEKISEYGLFSDEMRAF
jgi:Post-segregation antitoxin (ccd killing mechanism protein) encoded by the F plasmid